MDYIFRKFVIYVVLKILETLNQFLIEHPHFIIPIISMHFPQCILKEKSPKSSTFKI